MKAEGPSCDQHEQDHVGSQETLSSSIADRKILEKRGLSFQAKPFLHKIELGFIGPYEP